MKRAVLALLFLMFIFPFEGREPLRAVIFHKHTEQGRNAKRYYLSGLIEGSYTESATVRAQGNIYAAVKEGDTMYVSHNRLFDIYKLKSVRVHVPPPPSPESLNKQRNDSILKIKNDSIMRAKTDSILKVKADSIAKVKTDSIVKVKTDSIYRTKGDSTLKPVNDTTGVPDKSPVAPERRRPPRSRNEMPQNRDAAPLQKPSEEN